MSERFTNDGKLIMQNGEVWTVAHTRIDADVIAESLNILIKKNEQLGREYNKLKHSLLHDECLELEKNPEKAFLKIIDDYYIKYGDDGVLFNLHKPSDIRSLVYLVNRANGYSELQCEYNDLTMGGDSDELKNSLNKVLNRRLDL